MKVQRSCHVTLFGSSLREAVVAMTPMLATAARENADVAVKTGGTTWVASVIVVGLANLIQVSYRRKGIVT